MKKLLEFIVTSVVYHPKKVEIKKKSTQTEGENELAVTEFQLKVDPEDLKFVIGKKGRTIRAIRQLLRMKAMKDGKRVNLELVES